MSIIERALKPSLLLLAEGTNGGQPNQETLRMAGRQPKALNALGKILAGQESMLAKDLTLELERMRLAKNGGLTRLGYYAYSQLRYGGLRKT